MVNKTKRLIKLQFFILFLMQDEMSSFKLPPQKLEYCNGTFHCLKFDEAPPTAKTTHGITQYYLMVLSGSTGNCQINMSTQRQTDSNFPKQSFVNQSLY